MLPLLPGGERRDDWSLAQDGIELHLRNFFLKGATYAAVDGELYSTPTAYALHHVATRATEKIAEGSGVKQGTYNSFVRLNDAEAQFLKERVPFHIPPEAEIGVRVPHEIWKSETTGFLELGVTLAAARRGLVPNIYAAALMERKFNMVVYVVEAGTSLNDWMLSMIESPFPDEIEAVSESLMKAMKAAASMQLIMTDINAKNIIVNRDSKVQFIDLDAAFTSVGIADAQCTLFINVLLLTTALACRWSRFEVARSLTRRLRDYLTKQRQTYESQRYVANLDALCRQELTAVLVKDAELFDREDTDLGSNDDLEALVKHVMHVADRYAEWETVCNWPKLVQDEPALPQFLKFIEEMFANPDPQPFHA